eukprot:2096730-Pyramimonas_sp.AAC.1
MAPLKAHTQTQLIFNIIKAIEACLAFSDLDQRCGTKSDEAAGTWFCQLTFLVAREQHKAREGLGQPNDTH